VDPYSLNPDPDTNPDPTFKVNPDPIRIQGFDDQQNLRKKYSFIFLFLFLIKNCNLLIPRRPQRMSKLQEKPSALKREHPALKK
jgi:hypothetical protein